jgi:hypothetical protein
MPSSAFNAFHESFFGDPYMAWHDGLDVGSLLALQGDERAEAEHLLLDGLDDPRCVEGLGYITSQAALPKLREMLPTAGDYLRSRLAAAIWRITGETLVVDEIVKVLREGDSEFDRLDAAVILGEIDTPATRPALMEALADLEYLVRYNAAEALLRLAGFYTSVDLSKEAVFPDIVSDDAAAHTRAQQWVRNLVDKQPPKPGRKQNGRV